MNNAEFWSSLAGLIEIIPKNQIKRHDLGPDVVVAAGHGPVGQH